ncbi:MAG: YjbQ family protein [Eubacterium sp.]|nr:YjbQ family protein [Eubacterium sp.]
MKSYHQNFTVNIPAEQGYMDLTDDVLGCVRSANIRTGICAISTMHTTAAVVTAPNDPEMLDGYLKFYNKLATLAEEPLRPALLHQVTGNTVTLTIEDGELNLGLSQYIIYFDFDGQREKSISIDILGE